MVLPQVGNGLGQWAVKRDVAMRYELQDGWSGEQYLGQRREIEPCRTTDGLAIRFELCQAERLYRAIADSCHDAEGSTRYLGGNCLDNGQYCGSEDIRCGQHCYDILHRRRSAHRRTMH